MQVYKIKLKRVLMTLALHFAFASICFANNIFYIDATYVDPGETTTLAFRLDNSTKLYAFQADITLPDGLEFTTSADGKIEASLSAARTNSTFSITSNLLSADKVRLGVFSFKNDAFAGDSGDLLYIKATATPSFKGGNLTINNIVFTNAAMEDVDFPDFSTSISNGQNNRVFIGDFTINAGGSKTVALALDNERVFSSFQTDIFLPKGMRIEDNSFRMTSRGVGHQLSTETLSSGAIRLSCLPKSGSEFVGFNGDLVLFDVYAGNDVADNCVIQLKNTIFTTPNLKECLLPDANAFITVSRILVNRVQLSQSSLTMAEGQTSVLSASVSPSSASDKTIEWSSSNNLVATVDENGMVTALAKGSAIITASATDGSGVAASCSVTVTKPVSAITLSRTSLSLAEGKSAALSATVTPYTASNRVVEWSSSNEAVATVDQAGTVTARSKGSATITAAATDGSGVAASCSVTVTKLVASIELNKTELELLEGSSAQLTATVAPDAADIKTITWSSSNNWIATVDENGLVTARMKGSAIITAAATDGSGVAASCSVTVTKPVSAIILSKTSLSLAEGKSATLSATVSPSTASNKVVEWSSSNEAVATVDQAGTVTARSKGSATITAAATDGSGVSASCSVTVTKLVASIELNKTELELLEGSSAQLTATVAPDAADIKTVSWSSSNDLVATVDENGLVTALAKGSATITAAATDGSGIAASCSVTVTKPVSAITLSRTSLSLAEGTSAALSATVAPYSASNKVVEWSSSNEAVATVDQSGTVTARSKGSAIITASATDGSGVAASCSVTVTKLVASIELNKTELVLLEGSSAQLTATVAPDAADIKTISWSSSNNLVATVDENGMVTALAKGSAIITASATDGSGVAASCSVTVIELDGCLVLDPTSISLYEEEVTQLTATISPQLPNDTPLIWESSDDSVATVDQTGSITAHSKGQAKITVRFANGIDFSASCIVTVIRRVAEITLNESEITLALGSDIQLYATITPNDAYNQNLKWSSSDNSIVTVDANGHVVAVGKGAAEVTATSTDGSDISSSCIVNVVKPVSDIYLSETTVSLELGMTHQLTAAALPDDSSNATLTWSSSDPAIVSVGQDGLLTGVSIGTSTITVSSTDGSNITKSCEVTVYDPAGRIDATEDSPLTIITVENGDIVVRGKNDTDIVYVYNTQGKLIIATTASVIPMAHHAIVIVRVGNTTKKITISATR